MALSGSFETNWYNSKKGVRFEWSGTQSISGNYTDISYTIKGCGNTTSYHKAGPITCVIAGETVYNQTSRIELYTSTVLKTGTKRIYHDSNGTKSFSASISAAIYTNAVNCNGSGEWTLDTIPRYTSISSFSVSKRSETTLTFNWGTADTIDYAWYSTNNGSSWTGVDVTDGTSGSFNVSGLSANTSYNCKLRVRRKDSQLTTDSGTVSQTTYKIPTQTLASKTENKITMNWSIDATADHIWYSTNGGTNWTDGGAVNATSGSYTISGLSPNTTYNVRIRLRRKASQTTYDIASTSITTYKIPTHSLNSKTETSITMNWGADSTVDYVWYSKDNGTNWTGVDVTDGTSGTYTISGLTANTAYNIKTRCRRKATQTTYDVGPVSVTTYDYPHITAVETANLVIGNKQKLTLFNPLSRSVTVRMNKDSASGTQLYSGTSTGTSIEFTPTASTLYSSIPSSQSGKCVYTCVYGSASTKSTTGAYTYQIKGTEVPTFTSANIIDLIDTLQTAITGNNTKFIKSHNTLTGTIKPMTPNNSATGSKYVISATGSPGSQEKTYSTSNISFTISNLTASAITVTAFDSRGLSTSVTVNINLVDYSKPTISSTTAVRKDGVGEYAIVSGEGTYTNWSGLTKTNSIQKLYYRWKISTNGDDKYSSWVDITSGITSNTGGKFKFSKTLDVVFGNTTIYTLQFYATDLLEQTSNKNQTLSTADALLWRDLANKRIGVNKKPEYSFDVNGTINGTQLREKGTQITQIDITGTTTTLLAGVKHLATNGIYQATWFSRTDGGTSGISDKPTGTTNAGFVCEAKCDKWNSTTDYRYVLTCYVQASKDPYIGIVEQGTTAIKWTKQSLNAYPVGSIYISTVSTSPATLFGGTWTQITDRFLYATTTSKTTGGASTHSHTQGATGASSGSTGGPSNNTSGGPSNNTSGSTAITVDQMPSHTHEYADRMMVWDADGNDTNVATQSAYNNDCIRFKSWGTTTIARGGGKGHTHTLSSHTHTLSSHTHSLNSHTHTNPNTASASSMPPYFTVYAWHRTA